LLKLEIYLQDDQALSHGSAANVFIHGLDVMHLIAVVLNPELNHQLPHCLIIPLAVDCHCLLISY